MEELQNVFGHIEAVMQAKKFHVVHAFVLFALWYLKQEAGLVNPPRRHSIDAKFKTTTEEQLKLLEVIDHIIHLHFLVPLRSTDQLDSITLLFREYEELKPHYFETVTCHEKIVLHWLRNHEADKYQDALDMICTSAFVEENTDWFTGELLSRMAGHAYRCIGFEESGTEIQKTLFKIICRCMQDLRTSRNPADVEQYMELLDCILLYVRDGTAKEQDFLDAIYALNYDSIAVDYMTKRPSHFHVELIMPEPQAADTDPSSSTHSIDPDSIMHSFHCHVGRRASLQ